MSGSCVAVTMGNPRNPPRTFNWVSKGIHFDSDFREMNWRTDQETTTAATATTAARTNHLSRFALAFSTRLSKSSRVWRMLIFGGSWSCLSGSRAFRRALQLGFDRDDEQGEIRASPRGASQIAPEDGATLAELELARSSLRRIGGLGPAMLGNPIAEVGGRAGGIRRALVEKSALSEGAALVGVGLEQVGPELEPLRHGNVLELRARDGGMVEVGIGGRLLRVLVHRPAAREEEDDAGEGSTLHAEAARGARGEGARILGSAAGGRKERVPRARSPSGRI